MKMTRRRGCGCPLAGGTFCAASQKSTGTIRGFRGEAALHDPRGKRGTGECVFFLVHPLHRRPWQFLGDWDGPSSCASLRTLLKEFPVLCARAVRTWNLVPCFRCPFFWQSLFGRLGVAEEYGTLVFSGDVYFRWCNAWFDSRYMLCVSTLVASDVFHTFSTLLRTRILQRSFSIRFEWRSVPSRRFWLQSCSAQFALGNLEVLFTSFTWLRCVIRDRFFLGHLCQSQVPGCWFNP